MKKESSAIDSYITAAEPWAQTILKNMRTAIRAAAPRAEESISYRIPYFSANGRLAYLSAHAKHCSFHWISANDRKNFAEELHGREIVGQTLRIRQGEKVPAALIKKIVRSRLKTNMATKRKK